MIYKFHPDPPQQFALFTVQDWSCGPVEVIEKKQRARMAGLYERPSETYTKKRPRYPDAWFSKLAALTAGHHRAWDAGCGTGQASISVSAQSLNHSRRFIIF